MSAGDESGLLAFVISLNLKRRHLSESQRAAVAGELANLEHGQRADLKSCNFATLPPVTLADAADLLNVSKRLVCDAKAIKRANPEPLHPLHLLYHTGGSMASVMK